MSDQACSPARIDQIAADLNQGNREQAVNNINLCTMDLIANSDYARTMHNDGARVLQGEAGASRQADNDFAKLAGEERKVWQDIQNAAGAKDSAGVCKLEIVDTRQGPSPRVVGDRCN